MQRSGSAGAMKTSHRPRRLKVRSCARKNLGIPGRSVRTLEFHAMAPDSQMALWPVLRGRPLRRFGWTTTRRTGPGAIQGESAPCLGLSHRLRGPSGEWLTNGTIGAAGSEALNQAGLHLMPSSTGSGPQDR